MAEEPKEKEPGEHRLKGLGPISEIAARIAKAIEDNYEYGRPSNITAEKITDLLYALAIGNYQETACKYARISVGGFHKWMARGTDELKRAVTESEANGKRPKFNEKEEPYVDFVEAVEQAQAQSEMSAVVAIREGFKDNPKVAIEFLERRHRDRWHKKVELAGDPDNPVNVRVYLPDNKRGPVPEPKPETTDDGNDET